MGWIFFTPKKKKKVVRRRARRSRATNVHYLKHKEIARALVHTLLLEVNKEYHFPLGRVAIRNQKTCWGSCSSNGNLNFHYKILFLPKHLQRYLITHELCHLGEFNHSKRFWELVARACPSYQADRKELKTFEKAQKRVVG